jgi:protein-disulfide isomerase
VRFIPITLLTLAASAAFGATAPNIDKARLIEYVKYAEAFTDAVSVTVDDPTATASPDFYSVMVHMRAGTVRVDDKRYYVTADGQHFVNGELWQMGESPFASTLRLLPSGPVRGPADARVSIVVFSDFQCPFCQRLANTLRENVAKTFPKEVRVTFADFPLETKHPWARAGAEAGHCIGDGNADAFWTFHDWIFDHQAEIDPNGKNLKEKIMGFAKEKKWDADKIAACMDNHATAKEVSDNEDRAYLVGVHQTPTLFVDGRKVEGALPWTNLQKLIQYEVNRPKDISVGEK